MRLDKLTTKFHEALSDAQSLALGGDHAYIEPAHVLLAMLKQDDGPKSLLMRAGVQVPGLLLATETMVNRLPKVTGQDQVQVGPDLAKLLQAAEKESIKRGDAFIASELFLLALADNKGEIGRLVKEQGMSRKSLESAIDAVRGGQSVGSAESEGQREALKKYCIDLTERARMGKLDPVIGRDDEIRRAIQVLQRRTKNNPVLIGEPGVGKTAIVEGLAQRIEAGRADRVANLVPEPADLIAAGGDPLARLTGVVQNGGIRLEPRIARPLRLVATPDPHGRAPVLHGRARLAHDPADHLVVV
jgi:ATP-dependent Clp protease ATP-binding subunit ClpB